MNTFGNFKLGRVLLHLICVARYPWRARWHWKGITREFAA